MISKNDMRAFKEKSRVLLQTGEYLCLSPHPSLNAYISNYNITFPTRDIIPRGFTVMPCGCSTLTVTNDGRDLLVNVDGPTIKPYVWDQSSQPEMTVDIEFKPAGLYAMTGIHQSDLAGKTLPFEAINAAFSRLIAEAVEKSGSVSELAAILDALFLANSRAEYRPELPPLIRDICARGGNISVTRLANNACFSERQLNRIFKQFVGIRAKSFSRLIRINHTFRLLKKKHKSLAFISDVSGFHDLAHFAHDFKQICGVTPQKYRDTMSDFYNNPTRF